jgi:hypothetical protein
MLNLTQIEEKKQQELSLKKEIVEEEKRTQKIVDANEDLIKQCHREMEETKRFYENNIQQTKQT